MRTSSIFSLTNPEIYVITAAHQGQMGGQVATWVTLASLVPEKMRVVTIISPRNFTYSLMQASQQFVLQLLAVGQQDWLPLFGLQSGYQIDKFTGLDLQFTPSGIPILPGTCGWVECRVSYQVDRGDRVIFGADVIASQLHAERQPLRRAEALAALPDTVTEALFHKRQLDIEQDRQRINTLTRD